MRRIFSFIYAIPVLVMIVASSCSKQLDDAYLNPNADIRVPVEKLLPGILANMGISFSSAGSNYGTQNDGQYIGRYVQYWFTNVNGNQYDMMGGATGTSDILGGVWAMHYYGQGQNLNDMIKWATEEEKWDFVGVGQAIRAWGWLTLTDVHGEVILREAFDRYKRVFKYDEQQEVYDTVKVLCHRALANLDRTDGNVNNAVLAAADAYFNKGSIDKWKRFVYSTLAKTFHRVTNKPLLYQPDSVIFYANLAQTTNAHNASLTWSNAGTTGTYSFFAPFRNNIGGFRQSRFVANLLSGGNTAFNGVMDPRAWYLIRENTNGTFKGILPNRGDSSSTSFDLAIPDRPRNFWGSTYGIATAPANDGNARYIFKNGPIWPLVTAAEMKFVKAEAYYRKGQKDNALTAYVEGINLNFDQLISDYEVSVPAANKITAATRAAYLANPLIVPTAAELNLTHIMLQKYIAMYGWGSIETWVDMRRYHYTDKEEITGFQVYRDFTPPTGNDLFSQNSTKWVYRARPRFNSEYLYNVEELTRIGAIALDYNTKRMWFSEP